MLERDAMVWREFRIFTRDNSFPDSGKKGLVKPGEPKPQVLLRDLPEQLPCKARRESGDPPGALCRGLGGLGAIAPCGCFGPSVQT